MSAFAIWFFAGGLFAGGAFTVAAILINKVRRAGEIYLARAKAGAPAKIIATAGEVFLPGWAAGLVKLAAPHAVSVAKPLVSKAVDFTADKAQKAVKGGKGIWVKVKRFSRS